LLLFSFLKRHRERVLTPKINPVKRSLNSFFDIINNIIDNIIDNIIITFKYVIFARRKSGNLIF